MTKKTIPSCIVLRASMINGKYGSSESDALSLSPWTILEREVQRASLTAFTLSTMSSEAAASSLNVATSRRISMTGGRNWANAPPIAKATSPSKAITRGLIVR